MAHAWNDGGEIWLIDGMAFDFDLSVLYAIATGQAGPAVALGFFFLVVFLLWLHSVICEKLGWDDD